MGGWVEGEGEREHVRVVPGVLDKDVVFLDDGYQIGGARHEVIHGEHVELGSCLLHAQRVVGRDGRDKGGGETEAGHEAGSSGTHGLLGCGEGGGVLSAGVWV